MTEQPKDTTTTTTPTTDTTTDTTIAVPALADYVTESQSEWRVSSCQQVADDVQQNQSSNSF